MHVQARRRKAGGGGVGLEKVRAPALTFWAKIFEKRRLSLNCQKY